MREEGGASQLREEVDDGECHLLETTVPTRLNALLLLRSNDCVQGSNSFFTSKMRKICKNVNKHKMTSNLHTFIKQKFSPRWHATPNV